MRSIRDSIAKHTSSTAGYNMGELLFIINMVIVMKSPLNQKYTIA